MDPTTPPLRDYQRAAVRAITRTFTRNDLDRALLTLPCGTGKTVVAQHIATTYDRVIVFVPTVALLAQTLDRINTGTPMMAICSPSALSSEDIPNATVEIASEADEAALIDQTVTTDPDIVADFLRRHPRSTLVCTYASAPVTAAALHATELTADLLICDEAHRTTGATDKAWALPLDHTLLPARRRLFMTATARLVRITDDTDQPVEVYSMDSTRHYGEHISPLSFRQAINRGYLSDYRVAILRATHTDVIDLFDNAADANTAINLDDAAEQLALLTHTAKHPNVRSILVFHNTIHGSKQWARQMRAVATRVDADVEVIHVDGTSDTAHRTRALNALAEPRHQLTIVSNCKLFAEGLDIPALDAVVFSDPRTSSPDIVQIVGRAIRPHPNGADHKALIIIPVLERPHSRAAIDELVARTPHFTAWQVLTTLAEEDAYFNRVLHQWRLAEEADTPTDTTDLAKTISVDTGFLDPELAHQFRLRLVRRTTSHWVLTAQRLRTLGNPNPRTDYVDPHTGYPLGRRAAQVRAAKRANRLPHAIITMFEAIPGFEWEPPPTTRRHTIDTKVDTIVASLERGGLLRLSDTYPLSDGTTVPVGKWYRDIRARLTPEQHAKIDRARTQAP